MGLAVATVTVVVPDYPTAIDFYVGTLGLALLSDHPAPDGKPGKRWVTVGDPEGRGCRLLLARADGDAQRAAIGNQTGGRVFLFLETDDFAADHARLTAAGVDFTEAPRHEPYGTVAVFRDPFGNLWDLLEPQT